MLTHKTLMQAIVLFLIFTTFVILVFPGILQDLRFLAYEAAKKVIALKLDYQIKGYHSLKGDKFIIRHTEADSDLAPYILSLADEYYREVSAILGNSEIRGTKIPLVLYPDGDSLAGSFGWGGDKRAVGVYWAGSVRLLSPRVWVSTGSGTDTIREGFREEGPLTHEITHLFIDYQTRGNYSRWFTEGIAQYVEREITGFILGGPSPSLKKEELPIRQLEAAFDSEDYQLLAYWRSLLAVDYLVDNFGLDRIKTLVNELYKGKSFEKAFFKVYGFTPETLFNNLNDKEG